MTDTIAYQPIVLVEEFLKYLVEEETVCSLAIEKLRIKAEELSQKKKSIKDKRLLQGINYFKTASEVYRLAYEGFKTTTEIINQPLILWAYEKLWEGFGIKGEYRQTEMTILGALIELPPPERVPYLMESLLDWLYTEGKRLKPIKVAAIFHILFEVIHPFEDGNGRLGRILLNAILIERGLINVAFRNREEYLKALREGEKGAIVVVEALTRGRKLSPSDITENIIYYGNPEAFEDLIRKEMLKSFEIYGRKLNILLSPKEVAELLNYKNPDYVRVLINRGKLKGIKTSGGWKIPLAEVIRFASDKLKLEAIPKVFSPLSINKQSKLEDKC
jgi:Fic family protein